MRQPIRPGPRRGPSSFVRQPRENLAEAKAKPMRMAALLFTLAGVGRVDFAHPHAAR
jgi:hypothetical protein